MKNNQNVINLRDAKNYQEIKKVNSNYGLYLKGLNNSQLENEINFLITEISHDNSDLDNFQKGKLILKEITTRVDAETKAKIQKRYQETLDFI
jgi:hypothetical protein